MKNHTENVRQKLVQDLFIILVNNPRQLLHARNYFKNKIFWRGIIKKLLKSNFLFSFEPSPLSNTKGTWNRWPVAIQVMKQAQKNSFISYVLSDQVWWYNIKRFLSYSKNYICKFMQAKLWHHKLFHLHLPFWIWKVSKGREKVRKNWISRERKELFRWNKKHFS